MAIWDDLSARAAGRPETKLWTRWWWMGSALDPAGITAQMEALAKAGFGGVEISPIYGVRGHETHFVDFLSEKWFELLAHALAEGERLGMGVDLIEGTGWPFGGPWVAKGDSAKRLSVTQMNATTGESFTLPDTPPNAKAPLPERVAAVAVSSMGSVVKLEPSSAWTPSEGNWKVYVVWIGPTGQAVKRAAPGGDGLVLDHFDPAAVSRYTAHFERAFQKLPGKKMVRCVFNDSWEVYGANAPADLLARFRERRGYDLAMHLPALRGDGDAEAGRRVRADFRRTIHECTLAFVNDWSAHARRLGARSRNQAHGSPGNLLDLYAAADIPETELFGAAGLAAAHQKPLSPDPKNPTPQASSGDNELRIGNLAASAGHIAGRPLISSESFTWLGEHGCTPLSHVRATADLLFCAGVNHLFCHGTAYSPPDAPWPGWMFYASTHFAPTNPFFRDIGAFTAYVERCQSALQAGLPDSDILLYFPFEDLLHTESGAHDLLQFLTVHAVDTWMQAAIPGFFETFVTLQKRGFAFDAVSDALLSEKLTIDKISPGGTTLRAPAGNRYRAIVVPRCQLLPLSTLERLDEIAAAGVPVLIVGAIPDDVPGLFEREGRRTSLQRVASRLRARPSVVVGDDVEGMLVRAQVRREAVTDAGTRVVRRRVGDDHIYFLCHPGPEVRDGWVAFSAPARGAEWLDPETGERGAALLRHEASHSGDYPEIHVRLEPGETRLLRLFADHESALTPLPAPVENAVPVPLTGEWTIEFVDGGPALPPGKTVASIDGGLPLWTMWDGDGEVERAQFSGTARYRHTFDAPGGKTQNWALSLGEVCHCARVRMNGAEIGVVYAPPSRIVLPPLKRANNTLEIEVTNLMANRLAALDKSGADWKPFFFVDIRYKPFTAAHWQPLPSGLAGPIALVRMGH